MTSILGNENIVSKIAKRQLYNGNSASTIMFCVELENLFLELGGWSYAQIKFCKEEVSQT